jgi:hypothetical protein
VKRDRTKEVVMAKAPSRPRRSTADVPPANVPNPGVTVTSGTGDEVSRYLRTVLRAEAALGEAIALLEARKVLTANPDEARAIVVQVARLSARQSELEAERLAFLNEQATIAPPSDAVVDEVSDQARRLDQMVANALDVGAVIHITERILELWSATQI